jgi:hypothetical protein
MSQPLHDAIKELSSAVKVIEQRISSLQNELSSAKKRKKQHIDEITLENIPDLSSKTLDNLRSEFGGFTTHKVVKIFSKNHRSLFIFKGRVYKNKLSLIRSSFSAFLDDYSYGSIPDLNDSIRRLTANIKELTAANRGTLYEIDKKGIPLSAPIQSQIDSINQSRERFNKDRSPSANSNLTGSGGYTYYGNDNFNLYFYLVTDIPTNMNTLLIDSIRSHHDENPVNTNCAQEDDRSKPCVDDSKAYPTEFDNNHQSGADIESRPNSYDGASVVSAVAAVAVVSAAEKYGSDLFSSAYEPSQSESKDSFSSQDTSDSNGRYS